MALLSDLLVALAKEGACVVVVNQNLVTTSNMCDYAVLLNQRVVTQGPSSTVLTSDGLKQTYAADLMDLEAGP